MMCQAQVAVTSPCLPAQFFTPFGLFRPAGSIRLNDLVSKRKCNEDARHISAYQRPAAPAQVRQAHTRQGLLAATDRAAQTWTRLARAVLRPLLATLRERREVMRKEHFDRGSAGDSVRTYGAEQGNMPCMHIEPVKKTRGPGRVGNITALPSSECAARGCPVLFTQLPSQVPDNVRALDDRLEAERFESASNKKRVMQ